MSTHPPGRNRPPKTPPRGHPLATALLPGGGQGGPGGRKTGDPKRAGGAKNAGMRTRRRPKGGAVSGGGRGGGSDPGPPDPPWWPPAGYCATTWKGAKACPGGRKPAQGAALGRRTEPQRSQREMGLLETGIGKRSEDMGSVATQSPPYRGVGGPPPRNLRYCWPYDWRASGGEKKFSGRAPNLSRRSAARSTLCPKAFQHLKNACGAVREEIRHGGPKMGQIWPFLGTFRGSGGLVG